MSSVPTVSLYGIPVSKLDMKQTVQYLTEAIEQKRPHQVITANPIMLMAALENPNYHRMMQKAELIVPDGTGVVWAANYVGNPVSERVPGYDLMHELMKVGEKRNWKVYLLGASPDVIQACADKLKLLYPGIQIVGVQDGYFGPERDEEIVSAIEAAAPDILLVGRSADTQEPWIAKYKERLGIPIMMGVGGSFDVLSGKLKRAPVAFQKMRLEWFYRLLQEPYRYKRMLVLPQFAVKVIREKSEVQKPR